MEILELLIAIHELYPLNTVLALVSLAACSSLVVEMSYLSAEQDSNNTVPIIACAVSALVYFLLALLLGY